MCTGVYSQREGDGNRQTDRQAGSKTERQIDRHRGGVVSEGDRGICERLVFVFLKLGIEGQGKTIPGGLKGALLERTPRV
jgi:hypothetical protein